MQGLLRLAGWGAAATAALLLVVIAANSGGAQQRLAAFNGSRTAELAKAEAAQAAQLARLAATEGDTRRLIEMVRALSTDRERVLTRVAVLERSLEDVTGSVRQQAATTPPAATQPPSAPPAGPPPTTTAAPQKVSPAGPAAGAGIPSEPPTRVANVAPSGGAELETSEARPAAGVDVGGATNFDGLRVLWNAITSTHFSLFEGLHPIVTVRENSKSRAADLRLVAGPLTDVESAARICTMLAAAKRYCRLVAFEGQPLALIAPEPPRRPAAPKPRPTVRPAP